MRRHLWAEVLIREGIAPDRASILVDELLKIKGPSPDKLDLMKIEPGTSREYPIAQGRSIASCITKVHKAKRGRFSTMRLVEEQDGGRPKAISIEVTRHE